MSDINNDQNHQDDDYSLSSYIKSYTFLDWVCVITVVLGSIVGPFFLYGVDVGIDKATIIVGNTSHTYEFEQMYKYGFVDFMMGFIILYGSLYVSYERWLLIKKGKIILDTSYPYVFTFSYISTIVAATCTGAYYLGKGLLMLYILL